MNGNGSTCRREFLDNFDAMVEDGASWAYKFKREHDRKTKDLDDVYFDIKDADERRKKGLPPRVAILPGWDGSDEERYDERRAATKRRTATKKNTAATQQNTDSAGSKKRPQTVAAQGSEGEAKR